MELCISHFYCLGPHYCPVPDALSGLIDPVEWLQVMLYFLCWTNKLILCFYQKHWFRTTEICEGERWRPVRHWRFQQSAECNYKYYITFFIGSEVYICISLSMHGYKPTHVCDCAWTHAVFSYDCMQVKHVNKQQPNINQVLVINLFNHFSFGEFI